MTDLYINNKKTTMLSKNGAEFVPKLIDTKVDISKVRACQPPSSSNFYDGIKYNGEPFDDEIITIAGYYISPPSTNSTVYVCLRQRYTIHDDYVFLSNEGKKIDNLISAGGSGGIVTGDSNITVPYSENILWIELNLLLK